MNRGGARGRGGRGGRFGRRPGRRGPPRTEATQETSGEKILPQFVKVKDIKPGNRSYDIVVKVTNVNQEASRTERRGGRMLTFKCSEALIGDDTGCIRLSTRFPDKAVNLIDGKTVALLNVKLRRAQDNSWIEVDNWSAVKPVEEVTKILPENFDLNFELNTANDRSKKTPPRPTFMTIHDLEPEKKGIYIIVKVVSAKIEERARNDGSKIQSAEATVGDTTGLVTLIARGEHISALKEGAILAIFNAQIIMVQKKFMRLVVDRWSNVKDIDTVQPGLLPESVLKADSELGTANRSNIEWELQDEDQ